MAGVRDYGNRMGIPTVNGAIVYHDDYRFNPLVFCGCVGIIPRDKIDKAARPGDRVVVMGGRTGRDGIHGATFSSAELTDTAGSEFGHAVQIGNAITEKKVADVLLIARDRGLFTAVTDCGAGGLSSAVGEMGEDVGASVQLDKVPLKYAGLRYDEVWISEAQERMVLSVPPEKLDALLALSSELDVETTAIGTFGPSGSSASPDREEGVSVAPPHTPSSRSGPAGTLKAAQHPLLHLTWQGTTVANMPMAFVHDGIPMPTRQATVWARSSAGSTSAHHLNDAGGDDDGLKSALLRVLAHPNVASKHRIVRQYDHEVQGNTVVKPFVGPLQIGPADAAVVRPKPGSHRGVAIACGLAPHLVNDAYAMSVASIDEAVRNAICVGVDPHRLALLDNFCWPGTDSPEAMGTLVLACEACRDIALAWKTPFVSGKDSLHNQHTDGKTGVTTRVPPTLLISAFGIVDDVRACVTSDLKRPGDDVWLVRPAVPDDQASARTSFAEMWQAHLEVSRLIRSGTVVAAHDVSDGGWLTAVAEMAIGGNLGVELSNISDPFVEPLTTYILVGRDLDFQRLGGRDEARHGGRIVPVVAARRQHSRTGRPSPGVAIRGRLTGDQRVTVMPCLTAADARHSLRARV